MTQRQTVLNALQTNGSIGNIEAITHHKILRLAAIICELRQSGYNIETKTDEKNGVATYHLVS